MTTERGLPRCETGRHRAESPAAPRVDAETTPGRLLWRSMTAHPRLMLPALLLSATHQIGEMAVPVIVGLAIDHGIAAGDGRTFTILLALLALDFLVLSTAYRYASRLGWISMNYVEHGLRMRLIDRMLDPRGLGGQRRLPGELLAIASTDARQVAMSTQALLYPVGQAVGLLFGAVILLRIHWPLGVATILGAFVVLVVAEKVGGPLAGRFRLQQQAAADAAGTAADMMQGVQVIKGLGADRAAELRYRDLSQRALGATLRSVRSNAVLTGSMRITGGLLVASIAVAGALLAVTGGISLGQMITVIGLAQLVTEPLNFIGDFGAVLWATGKGSAARVLGILQAPRVFDDGRTTAPPWDGVPPLSLDITFGDRPVTVAPGALTVLDLPATEVVRLTDALAMTVPAEPGTVSVGGVDLAGLDPEHVRARILVAPHRAQVFGGTVADNIAEGHTPVPPEGEHAAGISVETAALAAGLDDIITSPDGLGTATGDSGDRLSGGQRQRVALARALVADPEVLVLDHPTTAVDSVTEARIVERTRLLRRGRTTLVLTASPAWRAAADSVTVPFTATGEPVTP
ncbi:ABC transporter transmembrane domain-containing protein [Corynebacterium pygosceleis]|uniref:ABC transporter transmembrane domain-containing protein n=1 Tax=Corynebacterium pygosceleis TaxID=2800406 RepID=UPI001F2C60F4|nr:ABC transporter ATP-binding protein [Corynebacterium pygosceleis]MCK7674597.1 ABC transporter ATP-binding protein/permease [Corynebacterium pygosceleis]MCL0120101.1 ABC transporter ATP-binding protein/permease [Corynebacterium pygosceleis]